MIEELAYSLETDLILAIAKAVSVGDIEMADWKIDKLSQLSIVENDIRKIVSKYRAKIITQTRKELLKSAQELIAEIRSSIPPVLGKQLTFSDTMQQVVESWTRTASNQINIAMATLAQSAGREYVKTVNKASMSVITGAATRKEALVKAVSELESIDAFIDNKNRHWTPEGYIPTVIRTNSNRVVNDIQLQSATEIGTDLVFIRGHAGARPKCYPYQDHIFSLSGKSKKYPYLYDPNYTQWGCTLGMPDGLFGINCGHKMIPYVEGQSDYMPLDMGKKKNDIVYQQSQEQRRLERNIRNAKRQQMKYQAVGDKEGALQWKQRVKESNNAMENFIARTERKRRSSREDIYT